MALRHCRETGGWSLSRSCEFVPSWYLQAFILVCSGAIVDTSTPLRSVSLMSKPSWFDSSNNISEISEGALARADLHPFTGSTENLRRVRCLWLISFIQDIRTLMSCSSEFRSHGLALYIGVRDAVLLLQTDSQRQSNASLQDETCTRPEFSRLACLFFISVLLQGSVSVHNASPSPAPDDTAAAPPSLSDLAGLDIFLRVSRDKWEGSVENLHSALFSESPALPDGARKVDYVLQMTNVLGSMGAEARRGVEKCLLHILLPAKAREEESLFDDNLTPDSLLSSLHRM